ncbi:SMI1/KNR4 family protein [Kribbella deserti]|uniref:SMI1/KNR4 family protein n=1 Tax=Kribbella deserti TaxID=1926257 RepID=A0ABV6QR17_9ACTN
MTNWPEVLAPYAHEITLHPGCSEPRLAAAKRILDRTLPQDLHGLYRHTDGIYDISGQWFSMWRLTDLVSWNLTSWREGPSERRTLLAFGDDGTGDPFCASLDRDPAVYSWSPVSQEATHLADNLEAFWPGWLSGQIGT